MKCVSCQANIDAKWAYAINNNACPWCGHHIMEEHLKNCITSLASAMNEMLKYPEQLNDWLLSNHSYIKTSSSDLVNYLPEEMLQKLFKRPVEKRGPSLDEPVTTVQQIKVPDGNGGFTIETIQIEKTQSAEQTNAFFDRAEVLKGAGKSSGKALRTPEEQDAPKSVVEKTKNLKKLMQQIKTESSQGIINENNLAVMRQEDLADQTDSEATAFQSALQSALGSGDIISSGLPQVSDGGDEGEDIPNIVQSMASRASNKNNGVNDKDLETLHKMQNKTLQSQRNLGKGGFSRSS